MTEKSKSFEEVGKTKCAVCGRGNYQTTTTKPAVYDAYCVACRGLFRLYIRSRGMTDAQAKEKLYKDNAPKQKGTETGRYKFQNPAKAKKLIQTVRVALALMAEPWTEFRKEGMGEV